MTRQNQITSSEPDTQPPQPYPGLKSLNKLAGTWKVSGPEIKGRVRFEWMEGGFFLIQHVDFVHTGRKIKGIEIIGYDRPFGAAQPGENIRSHWYGNTGDTFDHTYEVTHDSLTIWGGEKGSPAYYNGKWSDDGNTNTGGWVYPGGGGYESSMTRVKSK